MNTAVEKCFAEQVADVRAKYPNAPNLVVANPPNVFAEIGLSQRPLLMRGSKINEILDGSHKDITLELLMAIPELIENSIIAIDSKTNPGKTVVFVTQATSAEGPVIIPVQKNQYEKYHDPVTGKATTVKGHTVASIYGKRQFERFLKNAIEKNRVLYRNEDKDRVDNFLASHGASQAPIARLPRNTDPNE